MQSCTTAHICGNLRNNLIRKQTTKLKRNKPHVRATCIEFPIIKWQQQHEWCRNKYLTTIRKFQRSFNPKENQPRYKTSHTQIIPPERLPTEEGAHRKIITHDNQPTWKSSHKKRIPRDKNNSGKSCHKESNSQDTIPTDKSSYRTIMEKEKSPHRKNSPLL